MKFNTTMILALLALGFTSQAKATLIAIIDSGTDVNHPDLVNHKWVNPGEGPTEDGVDNDNNGYIDDNNGWNFADGNNKLYDKSFLGTFSADTYNFFAVQTRLLLGTGTAADLAWIEAKEKDAAFIANLETFANFVHGSHVAGIASKNSPDAELMILKIMATKKPAATSGTPKTPPPACTSTHISDKVIKEGLKLLASEQGKAMVPWGQYVNKEKARLANCSFGVSTTAATSIIEPILAMVMKCTPSAAVVQQYASYFVQQVIESQKVLVTSAPNTLFIIAAGNDGMNNDVLPSSPSNIKMDNTLAVAATLDYEKLANFSNYGATMVDVAAPGVGISSSIPGDMHLTVSGTSQATPYVVNTAGQMLDQNSKLTNSEVKQILMGTVDLKDFLTGKVASGGIVNPNRAIMAAKLSLSMSVTDAVAQARAQVADMPVATNHPKLRAGYEGYVMPLPTLFN
jgi:cell wall-associated protease